MNTFENIRHNDKNAVITVYGNSQISIEPNITEVQLGVATENTSVQQAQQENARIMQQIQQALQALNIPPENRRTSEFSVQPIYHHTDGVQQLSRYQVIHMLAVQLDNIKQTGKIIDTAIQHGANRVANVIFSVSHVDHHYKQVLQLAVRDAYIKAEALAQMFHLKLHPIPLSILEQTYMPPPTPYQSSASAEIYGGFSTPIEPGSIELEASVEVQFQYMK
ncbi:SIMPL domain-containing protein [Gracilibacillus sp. YIM 98692]|uniref:SIMPL domain-containing protein n=1 Tax=Gracilibacillus sp. YIM 98692 TaxID=2663532 RepID=UPI0013D43571|nr:SIMPL domain-containing protein [Gracilibacillus sp. YIM 98692]